MEKIAILIPVFNGLNYTKKALANLEENIDESPWQLEKNLFVIVIDDGSTDGTASWIRENFGFVHMLYGSGSLWWSGAINMGAKMAFTKHRCTHVLLWNNDITPEKSYFKNLYHIVHNEPQALIFGSKILIQGTNLIWSMGSKFNCYTGKKMMIGLMQPDSEKFSQTLEVDWITGMGTIVHRRVVEQIGYWDEVNFPQYHGDSDFTLRAMKAGFKLQVFPALRIYNNIENTGITHKLTFQSLKTSLTSIKSDFNFRIDNLFYRKHASSMFAYLGLYWKYFRYIGGFFKQKFITSHFRHA